MSLTLKQERFVDEYAVDQNATKAAIRAGYSEKTAGAQGSRLLTNVEIRAVVDRHREERASQVHLTADIVLGGLLDIALHGSVDSARVRAYELLGKHLALFTDRLEVTQITKSMLEAELERLESEIADH